MAYVLFSSTELQEAPALPYWATFAEQQSEAVMKASIIVRTSN